jgi:hypothetical protein
MDAGVAIAYGHSIAGPAWAAIPFTSAEPPLAYLLLKAGRKKAHKAQKERRGFEYETEIVLLCFHFVPFVPFCG